MEIRYEFVNMKEEITLEKMNKNDIKNMYIKSEIRIEELEKKNIKQEEMVEGLEEKNIKLEELIKGLEERIIELEDKITKYFKINNKNIYLSRKDNNYNIYVNNIYYRLWQRPDNIHATCPCESTWTNENKLMIRDNNLILIIEYLLNNNVFYFKSQFMKKSKNDVILYEEIYEYLKEKNKELLERIKKEFPEIKILNI